LTLAERRKNEKRGAIFPFHALCQFSIFILKNCLKSSLFRVTRIRPFTTDIAAICPSTNLIIGDVGSLIGFLVKYPSISDLRHTSETVQPTLYSLSYQSASSERYRLIISKKLVSPQYDDSHPRGRRHRNIFFPLLMHCPTLTRPMDRNLATSVTLYPISFTAKNDTIALTLLISLLLLEERIDSVVQGDAHDFMRF
jgi:hypothetical protein